MPNKIAINTLRNRPQFKFEARLSLEAFKQTMERAFALQQPYLGGFIAIDSAIVRVRKNKSYYWHPQLQIRVEQNPENPNTIIVRGLLGPKPAIWTLFVFFYSLGFTLLLFFGMIWFVQYRLQIESDLIIWAWVGIAIIFLTYTASKVGQHLAKEDSLALRNFMEFVIDEIDVL